MNFNDPEGRIRFADMTGDGLKDIVLVGRDKIQYWPNLGYGKFGEPITMSNSPPFPVEGFESWRLFFFDLNGSGCEDLVYVEPNSVLYWPNQSGNGWGESHAIENTPDARRPGDVQFADFQGTSTATLVWSRKTGSGFKYELLEFFDGKKPYLLEKMENNMGAITRVSYAPSTRTYLKDDEEDPDQNKPENVQPWMTNLPFPVHVLERSEVIDQVGHTKLVSTYKYHYGYYDGREREFRGFGRVDQYDTEEFGVFVDTSLREDIQNAQKDFFVPPVLTKTWFHTGVYFDRNLPPANGESYDEQDMMAAYRREFYDDNKRAVVLDDHDVEHSDNPHEAYRALRGSIVRSEVYALDGSDKERHPYSVSEHRYKVKEVQPKSGGSHGIYSLARKEGLVYNYERNPADPRKTHHMTLKTEDFGNVLEEVSIGYGRRRPDRNLVARDQAEQTKLLITYTESRFTNAIDATSQYCAPLRCESRTYELTGLSLPEGRDRFNFDEVVDAGGMAGEIDYEKSATAGRLEKRLIEHVRTYYRRNDLAGRLPLCELESLALPFESYKLAFTLGLVEGVYGGRASDVMLEKEGGYVHTESDANWWIPSGQIFYSPDPKHAPPQELAYARQHFFLPHRFRDPFHSKAVSTESFITYDTYDCLVQETRDALGNRLTVGERNADPTQPLVRLGQDYRVLQPALVMDPNRNRSEVAFDALGMVVGTAVMGKPAPAPVEGDSLTGFRADLTQNEIDRFLENPKGPMAAELLANATTRIVYDLTTCWREPDLAKKQPPVAATLARERHVSDSASTDVLRIQTSFSYSDGFGREVQKKTQAEPGPAPRRNAEGRIVVGTDGQPEMIPGDVRPRWVGSGWTVFNNKGKPVRQFEPFFTSTHRFEFDIKIGVSPVLFYDPRERVVATLHPNHTWEKVVFEPWRQETWDVNDTVLVADPKSDADVGDFFSRLANDDYLPTWDALRTDPDSAGAFAARYPNPTDRANETRAAEKTRVHAATPTVTHADSLGHTFLTVVQNKFKYRDTPPAPPPVDEFYRTRIILDIEGNQREVFDAKDRIVMRYDYDMLGNRIHQASMEAGERWILNDVTGKPLYAWDSRNHRFRTAYDPLRRPTDAFLRSGTGAEMVVERSIYGESCPNPEATNLCGKVVEHRDQAGIVISNAYDFKGNLLLSQRRLAQSYKATLDWSGDVPLQAETYTSRTRYDALSRPIQLIAPHSDQPNANVNVIQPIYNDANLLKRVDAWLNHDNEPADWLDLDTATLHAVTDIDYDAKGQRLLISYGNGTRTSYKYDSLTFRLVHLFTRRNAVTFPNDCPQPPPAGWPGCQVQNLHYTYDPVGNIAFIRDDAQQAIYFRNKRVEPSAEYTYDAIYQLIEATGREHLGQGSTPIPHSFNDAPRVARLHPGDGKAMGRYIERYIYDAVGNILEMQHRGTDPLQPGWTRTYAYNEDSLTEGAKKSNRLSATQVGNGIASPPEQYSYDAHGNMLRMTHLQTMQWDFADQLQMIERQAVNAANPDVLSHHGESTWYVYDSCGQRVRKITELPTEGIKEERLYLGGLEIYSKNGANPLVRETLQIMDDKERIALVETRTQGTESAMPMQLIRYQYSNHLGSASLELDDKAQILSYEEYSPYGSTSYQAVRSQTESPKRYRYIAKERDDESGLCYCGARYYAPWICGWCSTDPIFLSGSTSYGYAMNNPVRFTDSNGLLPGLPGHQRSPQEAHDISPEGTASSLQTKSDWFRENLVGGIVLGAQSVAAASTVVEKVPSAVVKLLETTGTVGAALLRRATEKAVATIATTGAKATAAALKRTSHIYATATLGVVSRLPRNPKEVPSGPPKLWNEPASSSELTKLEEPRFESDETRAFRARQKNEQATREIVENFFPHGGILFALGDKLAGKISWLQFLATVGTELMMPSVGGKKSDDLLARLLLPNDSPTEIAIDGVISEVWTLFRTKLWTVSSLGMEIFKHETPRQRRTLRPTLFGLPSSGF